MSRVNDFRSQAGVFYLATADGDQPKARPLGLHFEKDGKVLFGIGDFKAVYRQMQANPKVEIVACTPDRCWLRYTGTAVFETDPAYAEAALDGAPYLRSIYNEETGKKLAVFYLTDAKAVKIDMAGNEEDLLG